MLDAVMFSLQCLQAFLLSLATRPPGWLLLLFGSLWIDWFIVVVF
jgi:hypothetical protein